MIPRKLCDDNAIMHYQGDTWNGFTIKESFVGALTDRPPKLKHAKLHFRDYQGKVAYTLDSDTGSEYGLPKGFPYNMAGNISFIDDPVYTWILSIDAQPIPIPSGAYMWDLEVTDMLNVTSTILTGKFTVCGDVTK